MLRILTLALVSLIATLAFIIPAAAQYSLRGEVTDVIDGKTVFVALPSGGVKVELQYIDVPDEGQQLNGIVKDHLRNLVLGKSVEYQPKTLLNDRTIGRLMVNSVDVSRQMLRDGAAWHVPLKVSGEDRTEYDLYASTEASAKNERLGVWSVAGLKPAWEVRAENSARSERLEQTPSPSTISYKPAPKRKAQTGSNPALGDVGALVNGYDAKTRRGYIGTSFLDVTELDKSAAMDHRTAMDFSYFYEENDRKGRRGIFVVNLMSISKKWRFLDHNDLILVTNTKNIVIGKPKRRTFQENGMVRESLNYEIDRATLDRLVNDDEVSLKVGGYTIIPTPGLKYLLYNLLQVSR